MRSFVVRCAGLAFLLTLASLGSWATEPSDADARPERPRRYVSGFFGWMDGDDTGSRLGDPGGSLAFGLGGGYRKTPHLVLEVDFVFDLRDYDLPEDTAVPRLVSVDDIDLTSTFGFFTVKGTYPASRVELFLGAGVGGNLSELELRGTLLIFPGTLEKERELTLATQLAAGLELAVSSRGSLGLEVRSLDASADFGALSGGEVDVGGRIMALTYKHHF